MSKPLPPSATLAVDMIRTWATANGLKVWEYPLDGSSAVLSACGRYRYLLWRRAIGGLPFMSFGMLNPSTADHSQDDPTIRRCLHWANRSGMAGPLVWNLFALRATDPTIMKAHSDPVGPAGDSAIELALALSGLTVAAWGAHGSHQARQSAVLKRCAVAEAQLHTLSLTKDGSPGHPLYLSGQLEPQPWSYNW